MMISESEQFMFVHARKTAGMSVRKALEPYIMQTQKTYPMKLLTKLHLDFNWRWHHFRGHASLLDAQNAIPEAEFDAFYKFTIVRNPWDRLVSFYHFLLQRPGHEITRKIMQKKDFQSFLHYARRRHERDPIYLSQYEIILDRSREIGVDRIMRFENLNEEWDALMDHLGLDSHLPVVNKSKHRDYREFYTDADIEFVAEYWKDDIEPFGYEFG